MTDVSFPSSYDDVLHWRRYLELYPAELSGEVPVTEDWFRWRGIDVHVDRVGAPRGRVVVVVVHGLGGYGRMFVPFAHLVDLGDVEFVAPDLPGYGLTRTDEPVSYELWRECVTELVRSEAARSGRPVVVFGASMGGLIAYDVAASTDVTGVVATCLLDPREPAVRRAAARTPWLTAALPDSLDVLAVADDMEIPIRWLVDMSAISRDTRLSAAVASDPLGGGNRVSLRFLRTFLGSSPVVEPEDFDHCPILLAHPGDDIWTPVELSLSFFDRIIGPKELVMLGNAGHLPVEQPGLNQLRGALARFLDRL